MGGGLARPFFLSLLTSVPCPCLSLVFGETEAGIFVLRRLNAPAFEKNAKRLGHSSILFGCASG
jgi:hypothetical protein